MPKNRSMVVRGRVADAMTVYPVSPAHHVGYGLEYTNPSYGHNFPRFSKTLVPIIRQDPRVRYGLQLLKGPIQAQTVFLPKEEADNPEIHETMREQGIQFVYGVDCKQEKKRQLILDTLNTFWQCGIECALEALDWGHSCSQIIYRNGEDGKPVYDQLRLMDPLNVSPIISNEYVVGVRVFGVHNYVNGLRLPLTKFMWHVHQRSFDPYWGQSRLQWCFVPWHETWTRYGARDIRRHWFMRNAFDGGQIRYPVGNSKIDGADVSNRYLAIQMMANARTGGFRVFTNEKTNVDSKDYKWEYEGPEAGMTPQGLMDYPEDLRMEILEALGIPPEVVESSSEGLGSATGRKVPLIIYFSTLFELCNNLVRDVDRFIIKSVLAFRGDDKANDYRIQRVVPLKSVQPEPAQPGKSGGAKSSSSKPKSSATKKPSRKKTDPVTKTDTGKKMK